MTRQIVLDTETTGLSPEEGHRIIEIGCVEIINRRLTGNHYHQYLQPDREIDAGAQEVHGISNEFLADKPRFADVVESFVDYIKGAELIIHNAPFDVGFIDHEFGLLTGEQYTVKELSKVTDSLDMARKMHPGQKNSLDALCRRYDIDNSQRTLHGALLDAEILADVYLTMTGGQVALALDASQASASARAQRATSKIDTSRLVVQAATAEEAAAHDEYLQHIRKTGGECLWDKLS